MLCRHRQHHAGSCAHFGVMSNFTHGSVEVFENKRLSLLSVVTCWVSLECSSESSVAAMLDMRARRR